MNDELILQLAKQWADTIRQRNFVGREWNSEAERQLAGVSDQSKRRKIEDRLADVYGRITDRLMDERTTIEWKLLDATRDAEVSV